MKKLLFLLPIAALASTPGFWEQSAFNDFVKGKLDSVSLSRDGRISPAPESKPWFTSGQPVVWTAVTAPDGAVYAATGHNGRVYRIEPDGASKVIWTSDRPEVFALAVDPKGVLYAAGSPDGRIFRIENGKAAEYFDPKTRYIWSLAIGPDGALYAGTGDGGRIFRITAAGKGEVWYSTGEGNVTSLLIDPKGRLFAGTEPNGILFEVTAKDKAFALYDSNLPEIRAVAPGPQGSIYAVALGGAMAKKVQNAQPNSGASTDGVISTTTSITVTADAGTDLKLPSPRTTAPATAPQEPATTNAENTGGEKSAIYKIESDNTVETLWSSKEENVYDVLSAEDGLYFATDVNGRIYHLTRDRKLTLITQTGEAQATRLLRLKDAILVATANSGRIYKLGPAAAKGTYESTVFDASGVARWGEFRALTTGNVIIRTRSGNGARPDATWSEWARLNNGRIASPNARFLQYEVQLESADASLSNISAAYLPQNRPPVIDSITVMSTPGSSSGNATPPSKSPTFSVSVTDTGDSTPITATGTSPETISRATPQQLTISWSAEDPDQDKLVYTLEFRGESEQAWKLLKRDLHDTSYSIDQDALPDGRYLFRVTASDYERQTDLTSQSVLIDNTPPEVHIQSAARTGTSVDVVFDARDAGSQIRRAEWAIDAGEWTPVSPVDGILDSASEQFRLHIPAFPAGEHLLVIRVADTAGNTGLGKAIIR